MNGYVRLSTVVGLAAVDVAVLLGRYPRPLETLDHLRNPYGWLATVGADRASLEVAQIGLWLTALWLFVGLLAALGTAVPGAAGRAASVVAGRTLPVALRTFIAGSIGLSVVVTPVLADATPHPGATTASSSIGVAISGVGAVPAGGGTKVDVPWPRSGTTGDNPGREPAREKSAEVVVRTGDSLWMIAARRLGAGADDAEISAEWPRWYRANTGVVGSDPSVIQPGERLQSPAERGRPS